MSVVRGRGLEPLRIAPPEPKSGALHSKMKFFAGNTPVIA